MPFGIQDFRRKWSRFLRVKHWQWFAEYLVLHFFMATGASDPFDCFRACNASKESLWHSRRCVHRDDQSLIASLHWQRGPVSVLSSEIGFLGVEEKLYRYLLTEISIVRWMSVVFSPSKPEANQIIWCTWFEDETMYLGRESRKPRERHDVI